MQSFIDIFLVPALIGIVLGTGIGLTANMIVRKLASLKGDSK